MDKDEILEKSRSENRDEREDQIKDHSMKWTFLTMVAVSAVFAFFRGIRGESVLDLAVVVCASVAVFQLTRFFKLRKSEHLIMGILLLCAAAICMIGYCLGR